MKRISIITSIVVLSLIAIFAASAIAKTETKLTSDEMSNILGGTGSACTDWKKCEPSDIQYAYAVCESGTGTCSNNRKEWKCNKWVWCCDVN